MFLPAAAGRPEAALMIGLSSSSTRKPPQPLAPGADQALSTSLLFLATRMRPSSRNSISPAEPVIGVLGAGGLVVPVVSFQITGVVRGADVAFGAQEGVFQVDLDRHLQRRAGFAGQVVFGDADLGGRFGQFEGRVEAGEAVFEGPSQRVRRKKSLISLQLTMPARPPGTGWGVLESVMPLEAA